MSGLLRLDGLTFGDPRSPLLGPISCSIPLTGTTAILGSNGAGKSLFLSLIHGVYPPSAGTINWPTGPANNTRHSRSLMGQSPTVLRRSVAQNIEFSLLSQNVTKLDAALRTQEAMERTSLTQHALKPAAALSGGEMRRMALARALVTDPSVLLLDEPFAGLDPSAQTDIENLVAQAAKTTPVLISNHDLPQTKRIADQILFFAEGRLIEHSAAKRFFETPATPEAKQFILGHKL